MIKELSVKIFFVPDFIFTIFKLIIDDFNSENPSIDKFISKNGGTRLPVSFNFWVFNYIIDRIRIKIYET